ncbi:hypothetical protein PR003_g26600 [Phytophthora rubi]|uniref:Uncharacterized protein n=1 Tax=Phytophthora rubi TaxID=129364 RepID=A0A6A3HWR9_9STRA|nr:hypothetical protein PR002_g26590 [Phytophthora rubi]KAE9014408.1 hypothetical protein PR001_g15153 [Phytophthora rubi]KAE9285374.1 hypothetical protein PR003_g26600 [Phytophthora rubi]
MSSWSKHSRWPTITHKLARRTQPRVRRKTELFLLEEVVAVDEVQVEVVEDAAVAGAVVAAALMVVEALILVEVVMAVVVTVGVTRRLVEAAFTVMAPDIKCENAHTWVNVRR